MTESPYRKYLVYVGVTLCTILLVFSIFSLAFFSSLITKAKEMTGMQPTGLEQAFRQLFYGISAYLYFPNIFLHIQFALLSVILATTIVTSTKEHISRKGIAISIVIGVIIGVGIVYYLINAVSLKPYP